ncbi:MAG: phage tail protein [Hydrogenovibrio crunogenus]|nr:phage tail protein [Hydrogenovibrio crunogenus]
MDAMQSLLTFLTETNQVVPEEKTEAWAQDGKLLLATSATLNSYVLRYTANFEITDVAINPTRFFTAVSYWINKYLPGREAFGLPDPEFFTERLQNKNFDLGLRIEFEEEIELVPDPNGEWLMDDGLNYSVKSDFGQLADGEILQVVDSHTQDNGLKN